LQKWAGRSVWYDRRVRNAEAAGSNPARSTLTPAHPFFEETLSVILSSKKNGFSARALEVLRTGTKTVPYLLYPVANAKILFDRENMITPLLEQINKYFNENTEVKAKWIAYYKQFKKEKAQFGYEKTTIIDVWNELEKEYSGGKIRRPFFNSFPFRNRLVFSILKRFL
jgi:hypothetical protein